jgi:hypothetical protein
MKSQTISHIVIGIVAVFGFSTLALAGPPLICHQIAIGDAHSLPAVALNYHKGDGNYDLKNLAQDTLAILDGNPSVLVHMETLRRATIYARQDSLAAKELLTRLHARADRADSSRAGALAWFDLGYLAEAYKQWIGRGGEPNPAGGLDGYAWVQKAIHLRGTDAEMEFGAAMITTGVAAGDHQGHVEKATAGAKTDALLAQNVAAEFGR